MKILLKLAVATVLWTAIAVRLDAWTGSFLLSFLIGGAGLVVTFLKGDEVMLAFLVWCLLLVFYWPLAVLVAMVYLFAIFWRGVFGLIFALVGIMVSMLVGIVSVIAFGHRR